MPGKHMTVGARLAWGFAWVIVAGVVIASIGAVRLHAIKNDTDVLVQDRMAKVNDFNQIAVGMNVQAIAVRNILLSIVEEDRAAERQRVLDARTSNNALLQALQGRVRLPEGQRTLQAVQQERERYEAIIDKILQFAAAGEQDQARRVLREEARPSLTTYLAAIDAAIAFQQTNMRSLAQAVEHDAETATWLMVVVAALASLVGCFVAWRLTHSLTRALGGEPDAAADIAQSIAKGDLDVQVVVRPGDTTSLMASMGHMRDALATLVARVRQGSESVANASAEIAQGNQDLSARTESQASALQQTAASMEELGATVRHNADNAAQANQLAQQASSVAAQGGAVVEQAVTSMRGIHEASNKIADIIGVIDGIAFQTNILALNAAVEAARAGEQGRGFAVVASEVRSLAGRSAEAAKEIKQLITDSVQRVAQGSQQVDEAGSTMQEVVTAIGRVTDLMGEISAATREQSSGVSQVGEAVTQMDHATQQNAALVEEMAAAAASLRSQSADLVHAVSAFHLHGQDAAPPVRSATPAPRAASRPAVAAPAKPGKPAKQAAPSIAKNPQSAAPTKLAAPKPASPKSAATVGAEDDWETF